jgi:hypothetical protein
MSEAVRKVEVRTRQELSVMEKALELLADDHDPRAETARAEIEALAAGKRMMLEEPPERSIDLSNPG